MSFWDTVEQDLAAVKVWFEGTQIGQIIEADMKAAIAELEQVTTVELENAVKVIGLNVLSALATGGTNAAIAAGIVSAEQEFKAIGKDITERTINTLVTTVVNQVSDKISPAPAAAPAAK
jgi:hypothetical protein